MSNGLISFYGRVSSKKQDVEKFKYYIAEYEKRTKEKIEVTVFEKISATKTTIQERKLWDLVNNQKVKKIIVPAVSRVGRSVPDGVDLIRKIRELRDDLEIYVMDKNLTIKKDMNPGDEYHFYDLLNNAALEVHNRSEFVRMGLRRRKEAGLHIGRSFGSFTLTKEDEKMVKALLRAGHTIREISSSVDVSEATIYRYLKREGDSILEEFGLDPKEYKWNFRTKSPEKRKK